MTLMRSWSVRNYSRRTGKTDCQITARLIPRPSCFFSSGRWKAMGVGGVRQDFEFQSWLLRLGVRYLTGGPDVGYILSARRADVKQLREVKLHWSPAAPAIASLPRSQMRPAGSGGNPQGGGLGQGQG